MIRISEVEEIFREVFDEEKGLVRSIDTLYEKPKEGDFLKLVISLHGVSAEDVSIIHTKFIFKTDSNKTKLIDKSFIYLYDFNCIYHSVEFNNVIDLKDKVSNILVSNNFGIDLNILSDFIEAPAMFLNYYMRKNKITDYSIFEVQYQPKFKTTPCSEVTFDFIININNNYEINLSIRKIDNEEEDIARYKFQFKFMDDIESVETDSLKNIHFFIGSNIAKILDKKLKNK